MWRIFRPIIIMSQYQLALNLSTETKTSIPAKPKRPLTVYNLFSILERNYIVQQNQKQAAISSNTASDSNTDPYASTRPARYRDVVLPSNWFVVGMNRVKRSKHEKHGVISFNDLTKEISLQWKSVDAETKQYCERIAADELERYRKDLAAYKAMYGENVAHAQKLTHKNKCETDCIAEYNEPLSDMVGVMLWRIFWPVIIMSQYQLTLKLSTDTKRSILPKPQRPLTVYNLFAILERNYIVQQNQKQAAISSNTASDSNTDPYASTRPARYRDVVLPSNWFVVGMNRVKRSKHKKHGVISFNDLTKEISLQWKSVDAETKQYCERIAADELERYRRDLAAYKAMYGENVAHAEKLTHKNKCETNCIAEYNEPLSDMVGVKCYGDN
ncbi:hypothetical protein HJC23_009689 [Cyclotella cryptica]|uniref:HMG box domain-containing protein n=1 Tax=Cyclotella cryptica TaxID=29204 RepID=A0ABD3Q8W9_9STRA